MNALDLARLIFDTPWVRFIVALIAANVLLGISVAIFSRRYTFYLGATADFLLSRVIPYLLGWGAVKLVAMTALMDYRAAADALETAVSLLVIAALIGKVVENLRVVFPNLPAWAGDKPRPEAQVSP